MIEKAIIAIFDAGSYTYLSANKVHYGRVPQNTARPYVLMQRISTNTIESKGNTSHIDMCRIQFTIVADKPEQIGDEIRGAIDGIRGATYAGVNVNSIRYVNEFSDYLDGIDSNVMVVDYETKVNR